MKLKFNKKIIEIPKLKIMGMFSGVRGLMFCRREKAKILLFNSSGAIHSLFVFFPFLILWLDEKNKIIDWKLVSPWKFSIKSKKKFVKFIEVPINRRHHSIVKFVVGEKFKKKE
ncbi:MAG: hypothetical protein U9Q06_00150 [Nanoarchaeota archaeon]|nr:hypothetical protein [Nanoarchaeota archaeon]